MHFNYVICLRQGICFGLTCITGLALRLMFFFLESHILVELMKRHDFHLECPSWGNVGQPCFHQTTLQRTHLSFFILNGGQLHISVFIQISSTKTINMYKL